MPLHTLRFITGGWVGNHFYAVDQVGGLSPQAIGISHADQSGWAPVDQNADAGATPKANAAFGVYGYRWHVIHIAGRTSILAQIFANIEHPLIQRNLHIAFFPPGLPPSAVGGGVGRKLMYPRSTIGDPG